MIFEKYFVYMLYYVSTMQCFCNVYVLCIIKSNVKHAVPLWNGCFDFVINVLSVIESDFVHMHAILINVYRFECVLFFASKPYFLFWNYFSFENRYLCWNCFCLQLFTYFDQPSPFLNDSIWTTHIELVSCFEAVFHIETDFRFKPIFHFDPDSRVESGSHI